MDTFAFARPWWQLVSLGGFVCAVWACDAYHPIALATAASGESHDRAQRGAQSADASAECAAAPGPPWSARDVLDQRGALEGHSVTLNVYEGIWDADHYSGVRQGEYFVDVRAGRMRLVGADWDPARPQRRSRTLPRGLRAPLQVVGEVFADPVTADGSWPETVIRVRSTAPLALPTPEHLASTQEIQRDYAHWEGHYIEVEGTWALGFETTVLDRFAWIDEVTYATRSGSVHDAGDPRPRVNNERVRVIGFVHTRGGHFGHLGQYPAEILATQITILPGP